MPEGQDLTDEQYQELESKFLSGELKEEEETEAVTPTEEGADEEQPEEEEETQEESGSEEESQEETEESEEEKPTEGAAIKENKRLREKNRELTEHQGTLQEKVNQLEAQFKELSQKAEDEKPKDPIKAASIKELQDTEDAIDDQLLEAREAGDTDRLGKLRDIRRKIRAELQERPKLEFQKQAEAEQAQKEWTALEEAIVENHPDLTNENSDLQKAARDFQKKNPMLAKQLGSTAGLVALAASVLLQEQKGKAIGKPKAKANKNLAEELESVAKASTKKAPATTPRRAGDDNIPDPETDPDGFDAYWQQVRSGKRKMEGL